MGANGPVGDAAGHPDDALLHVHAVLHVHSLADEFHDPGFALVGNGEGFALGGVAVAVCKFHDDVDGLTGGFCTLERDIDEGAVVDSALLVFKFGTAAPGGLSDDDLVLVHVANGLVGMGNLLYLANVTV